MVWVYNIVDGLFRQVLFKFFNVWVVDWVSNSFIVGVCLDLFGEEYWYGLIFCEINIYNQIVCVIFNNGMLFEVFCMFLSGVKVVFMIGVVSDCQIF